MPMSADAHNFSLKKQNTSFLLNLFSLYRTDINKNKKKERNCNKRHTNSTFVLDPSFSICFLCADVKDHKNIPPLVSLSRKGILARLQLDMENMKQVAWIETSEEQIPALKAQDTCSSGRTATL